MALSVAKLNLTLANKKSKAPFNPPLPEVEEALTYFKMSAEHDPKLAEAWKGIGFVLERLGKQKESQEAYLKAHALSPNDPSWQTVPAGR
jgi:Flp pilus assembly protein TadD